MHTNGDKTETETERFLPLPSMRLTIEVVGYGSSTMTLPDDAAAWIMEIADTLHTTPAALCGSMVTDVTRADREAHQGEANLLQ